MGSELIAAVLIAAFAIPLLIIPAIEHSINEIGPSEGISVLLSKALALVSNPIFDLVALFGVGCVVALAFFLGIGR